jgi:bromodomain-containing factor 1
LDKLKGLSDGVEKRERKPVERLEQTVDLEGNPIVSPLKKKVIAKPKTPRPPKVPVIDSREMTHEEKLELSQDITAMDPNKLHGIVGIIQKRAPKASTTTGGQEEIEIDLDKLDPVTLREIEKYVGKNIGKKKKAIARKSRPEAVQQIVQQPLVPETISKVTSAPEKESSDSETESSDSDAEVKKPTLTVEGGPKPLTQGN